MKKNIKLGITIVLMLVVFPVEGRVMVEKTVKFEPFGDSYVDSTNPTLNYASADLRVSYYTSTTTWVEISFLAFKVEGLPNDAVITAVDIELSVKSMPLDDHSVTIGIFQCDAFSETTITWNNKPSIAVDDTLHVSQGTITEDSRYAFHLSTTATFEQHTVDGNGNYYFFLFTNTDSLWAITFDSRDDPWNPPKLAVTYEIEEVETTTTEAETTTTTTATESDSSASTTEEDTPWLLSPLLLFVPIIIRKKRT